MSDDLGYQIGDNVVAILNRFVDTTSAFRDVVRSAPPVPPEAYHLLREALEENREPMDDLAAVELVGRCRFRYDFNVASPMDTLLPAVDAVSNASYLWRAQVLLSLRSPNYAQAMTGVQELCDTAELLRCEPFAVSQFTRARIGGYAVDSLEEVIAVVDLSDDQFRALDQRLASMESTFRLADTIRAERAALLTTMKNIGHHDVRESFDMTVLIGTGGEVMSDAAKDAAIDRWASLPYSPELMSQQAWMLDQLTVAANLIDEAGKETSEQWNELDREITATMRSPDPGPLAHLISATGTLRDLAFAYRHRLFAARLALRVSRYRSVNQQPPNDLAAVCDAELPNVPRNLWNGDEPSFNLRSDGFVIIYTAKGVDEGRDATVSVNAP